MSVDVSQFLNGPDITSTPTLNHGSRSCDNATYMNQDIRYTDKHKHRQLIGSKIHLTEL